VPLAGVLGLFHFGVVPEVKPFQPTTRITRLDAGWVAIVLSCDVVGNVRDLSAEGVVEGIIGRPNQRSLGHWSDSEPSKRARAQLTYGYEGKRDALLEEIRQGIFVTSSG
jgi:hypothetical protein